MESEERSTISSDLLGTVVRPPSIRVSGSFKSSLSGRLTPRSSPSFRRSPSLRTPPARDFRYSAPTPLPWYQKTLLRRRLLPWLVVIAIWAYIGLALQSRWAHTEDHGTLRTQIQADQDAASRIIITERQHLQQGALFDSPALDAHRLQSVQHYELSDSLTSSARVQQSSMPTDEQQHEKHSRDPLAQGKSQEIKSMKSEHALSSSAIVSAWSFPSFGMVNTSVGRFVGPFPHLEELTLGSFKKFSSCSHAGAFAKYVQGRSFMLVLHELSMTGSPLAMFELANELLACGGNVVVVALSQKGGLLQELLARKIKVLKNKAASTFKAAARVDLIVAGSAVCASWIENYELENKKGPKKLVWWIMENRKEYFDRSKHLLGLARGLIFLSEVQSKQWILWAQTEGILLPQKVQIVPLCVNEELSAMAGLYGSGNDRERGMERLRNMVRAEMGLQPEDVLLATLSSINPGKGQLKLLQAVDMVIENFEGLSAKVGKEDFSNLRLRLLIGSVGSKSNKIDYIQKMLEYIGDRPPLAESVLWTPVTVHVASLYAASDAYVMNSQGIGETFGRVTVEAMAFALPILGTSAGGTSEIVENDVSGLLHPVGADGVHVLAEHIGTLLGNATLRQEMGKKGKQKVKQRYMKEVMYEDMATFFSTL